MVGTGSAGLVSAACYAETGNDVRCVDVRPAVVENLNTRLIHIELCRGCAREVRQNMTVLVVVNKSTISQATSDMVVRSLIKAELDARGLHTPFNAASNPGFLKEGNAVNDFIRPGRVIVGTDHEEAARTVYALCVPFVGSRE